MPKFICFHDESNKTCVIQQFLLSLVLNVLILFLINFLVENNSGGSNVIIGFHFRIDVCYHNTIAFYFLSSSDIFNSFLPLIFWLPVQKRWFSKNWLQRLLSKIFHTKKTKKLSLVKSNEQEYSCISWF